MSEATPGGFNDPPWLGGGARAVVVWCGVSGGLAKKMAVALVVQGGGSPGGAFIGEQLRRVAQGRLHQFYFQFACYLKDFRLDSKKGEKS
jgi:hypothetical protein